MTYDLTSTTLTTDILDKLHRQYHSIDNKHLDLRQHHLTMGVNFSSVTSSLTAAPKPAAATDISFEDYLGLLSAAYEWADSYDSKDWDRLRRCIAPTLRVSFLSWSSLRSPPLFPRFACFSFCPRCARLLFLLVLASLAASPRSVRLLPR